MNEEKIEQFVAAGRERVNAAPEDVPRLAAIFATLGREIGWRQMTPEKRQELNARILAKDE